MFHFGSVQFDSSPSFNTTEQLIGHPTPRNNVIKPARRVADFTTSFQHLTFEFVHSVQSFKHENFHLVFDRSHYQRHKKKREIIEER